jgi:serine/threonine-protein kinase RsbW
MARTPPQIRLEFTSSFEMLDFVQAVGDRLAHRVGLDDDSLHWVSVAVRECVINAIKHGNRGDTSKLVSVEFGMRTVEDIPELAICVRDQGDGFEPEDLADPLAPENLLKASGRGIFLMRSFMDDVQLQRVDGGMEVRMVKRVQPLSDSDGLVGA